MEKGIVNNIHHKIDQMHGAYAHQYEYPETESGTGENIPDEDVEDPVEGSSDSGSD